MTTAIMARALARTTVAATTPEYAHRQLGDLLARMVRESDARIPAERRARRTLQEMLPGHERQPVLILHRPLMADDACALCGRWNCDPNNCPPFTPKGVDCTAYNREPRRPSGDVCRDETGRPVCETSSCVQRTDIRFLPGIPALLLRPLDVR